MNQQPKKRPKTKSKAQIPDLKPVKDAKGGHRKHHHLPQTTTYVPPGGIGPDGAGKWDY